MTTIRLSVRGVPGTADTELTFARDVVGGVTYVLRLNDCNILEAVCEDRLAEMLRGEIAPVLNAPPFRGAADVRLEWPVPDGPIARAMREVLESLGFPQRPAAPEHTERRTEHEPRVAEELVAGKPPDGVTVHGGVTDGIVSLDFDGTAADVRQVIDAAEPPACTCPTETLIRSGCRCGGR